MARIILNMAVTLDGFIARPDGGVDWCFTDQDYGFSAFRETIGTILMGRDTYEVVLSFGELPFKDAQCFVFSRNLKDYNPKHIQVLREIDPDYIRQMKAGRDRDIWLMGGGEVNGQFLELGLLDELQLAIHPLLLGEGMPAFGGYSFPAERLKLVSTRTFDTGLLLVVYRVLNSNYAHPLPAAGGPSA